MSNLEELIERLCPDGVEYKELKNIIKSLNTGLNPRKFFKLNTEDAKNYYVTIREIRGNKIVFSDSTDRINDDALKLCNNRSNLEVGDILFSGTGTIGMTALIDEEPINWNIKEGVYAIKPCSDIIDSKFLMYMLQSNEIKKECLKRIFGGTVKSISMKDLMSIQLPVPPLEVQREIVRILDNFTFLTTELAAELATRQKQYEYYKVNLLLENNQSPNVTLNDIAINRDSQRKPVTSSKRESGNIPYYGASGIVDYVKDYIFDGDYLLVSEDGANLLARNTPIAFSIQGKTWVNNHAHILEFDNYYTRRYVEFYLNSIDLTPYISGGAQPKLNQKNLNSITIPLPVLQEQQRIVDILDRFDTLCNDISSGLPAEIEARQKQYEYYRDKLLTFKELKKEA